MMNLFFKVILNYLSFTPTPQAAGCACACSVGMMDLALERIVWISSWGGGGHLSLKSDLQAGTLGACYRMTVVLLPGPEIRGAAKPST